MTTTVPVSEARQKLPDLVDKVHRLLGRVVITRKGKPEAVMMGIDEFESWSETLEILSRPETVKHIREGLADLKAGRSKSFEEVFGEPLRGKRKGG